MSSSDEEIVLQKRSDCLKRTVRSRQSNRKSNRIGKALEEMKEARSSGRGRRIDIDSVVEPVFIEVDEDEYMRIKQQRREDQFIVDGDYDYFDNGEEIFDQEENDQAPRNDETVHNDKRKKAAIGNFFANVPIKKAKTEREVSLRNDEKFGSMLDNFFGDSLEEFSFDEHHREKSQNTILRNPFKTEQKQSSVVHDGSLSAEPPNCSKNERMKNLIANTETFEFNANSTYDGTSHNSGMDELRPFSEFGCVLEDGNIPCKNFEETKFACNGNSMEYVEANFDGTIPMDENVMPDNEKTETIEESFVMQNGNDKSVIRFYWLDAFEDPARNPGTVYLLGRVYNKGSSESCCIVVKNIWRQVYFLPRQCANGEDTNGTVDFMQLNEEVQNVLCSRGILINKCKPVEKSFAVSGSGIPRCAKVLEVLYPSSGPKLPTTLVGESFSHVFNVTATGMERVLLESNMKGPCWLEISDYTPCNPQLSYALHEFSVNMDESKPITVIKCDVRPPPLVLLGLTISCSPNRVKENEIVMISCLVKRQCCLYNASAMKNGLDRFCLLTKPSVATLPFDLKYRITREKLESFVIETANERHLLSQFLCKLQSIDPDIVVGHDLPLQLSLLFTRLEKLKVAQWSRTGRLKKVTFLKSISSNKSLNWEMMAGRLILDSRLSAMELVKARSYDLNELASNMLGIRESVDMNNIASCYNDSKTLLALIIKNWHEIWLSIGILVHLNALPLFIQITQIVGGVLSRTLLGGRAERNEFLLLHAFHNAGYLVPDKHISENRKNIALNSDEPERCSKTSKKAQYMGGLVLEPRKGLFDSFILLFDFNSLYPSIIQEYNICFTTADLLDEVGSNGLAPTGALVEGILPREVRNLVERRREVKKLMAVPGISEQLLQQYNIRQMGLKLTANSLYGCLGFVQSRFYAKQLAATITSRGREILMHTKELIEKQGYSVIYGDTDSVMVDTGLSSLEQVKSVGSQIKKMINRCYKKLEIDIDGVYKKLLLLKKKKYAGLLVDMNDETKCEKEVKGLDVVRRDWSLLAKNVGNEIIDIIMFSNDRDELVEQILQCLHNLQSLLKSSEAELSLFEISKQLTKDVKEFSNLKSQPHVAVAKRLNSTGLHHFHRGDIIEFLICEDQTGNPPMQRAYHRSEVDNLSLKIDYHYYLACQVYPVVNRLCQPITEIDAVKIANSLGLNSSKYHSQVSKTMIETNVDQGDYASDEMNECCEPFTFVCPNASCKCEITAQSLIIETNNESQLWIEACPSCNGSFLNHDAFVVNQLDSAMTSYITRYSTAPFLCDDVVCAFRTRRRSIHWTREGVLCPKCSNGLMRREYTSKMLFKQQSFYRTIFKDTKDLKGCTSKLKTHLQNSRNLSNITKICEQLIARCDYFMSLNDFNRVSLAYLFSNMRTEIPK